MKHVSAVNMQAAIACLFNAIGKGKSEKRPNEDGDLERYAAIASFMTDEKEFSTAMRAVAAELQERFEKSGEKYRLTEDKGVWKRRVADTEKLRGHAEAFQKDGGTLGDVGALAKQGLLQGELLVRRFQFRPLLQEMEDKIGLVDKGRIMFGDPGAMEFGAVLRAGEVWKDSIAFAHGEYTHRLQWLAIAMYARKILGWDAVTILRLYRCAANPMKSAVRTALETARNTDKGVTLSDSLWNFLVDSFPTNAQAPNQFEPTDPIAGTAVTDPLTYKYAGRTDSFRSPNVVMRLLKSDATMGILHAYVLSSYMKAGAGSLSKYRRARLSDITSLRGGVIEKARGTMPEAKPVAEQLTEKVNKEFVLNQFVPNDGGLMLK